MKNRKTDAKRAGDETVEGPGAAHEAPRPEQELTRDSEGSTEMLRNCLEVMRLSELLTKKERNSFGPWIPLLWGKRMGSAFIMPIAAAFCGGWLGPM